ncbi:phytanoyl-CoA dioxygenase family protein [Paenibacillus sp. KQZ6P-2]|uniref:Phytanoyl-CoA dioxygenase family protein n=1 Tax=Paenibacillus mangrovi TaxID=2931978 RepID=A0A9X1WUB3_9BACL|nr:phytanoyl-CoA dioxygenase family protein [Paenibacillus mangrovi]
MGWHQDYTYWQCCKEPSLITEWVAFTDVDLSNGCMQMVPRSHKWGLLNVSDFFEQNTEKQKEMMDIPENESFSPVPIVMKMMAGRDGELFIGEAWPVLYEAKL